MLLVEIQLMNYVTLTKQNIYYYHGNSNISKLFKCRCTSCFNTFYILNDLNAITF